MRALVTGATGFLGGALTRRLLADGWAVTATGRNPHEGMRLEALGADFRPADLRDPSPWPALSTGQQVVFHCGARSAPWGRPADFRQDNVLGTRHVARAALAAGARLVHVSTPSLYATGRDALNIPEDAPPPHTFANAYAESKFLAEQEVRAATSDGLAAVTLRPRAVFGEGDSAIVPRLAARLARGRLPVIGNGRAVADLTYVENAVDALLLAARAPKEALGRAYNITNGEPLPVWPLIRELARLLNLPPPRGHVPEGLALVAAGLMEGVCARLPGQPEPPLTRYTVTLVSRSVTLDVTAARRDLRYAPRVTVREGLTRTAAWWNATQKSSVG